MRLVILIAVLAASRPAHACEPASPFELFDRAERVIVGSVTTTDAQRRKAPLAPVTVAVDTTLKGDAHDQVRVRPGRGLCAAELIPGVRAVMFLDAKGAVVGDMEGYLMLGNGGTDWPAEVERWAKATDDDARLDLLLDLIALPELESRRSQAADYLVNTPRLLAKIDATRRARIVAALADNHRHPNYVILILARLRAPELAAMLDDRPSRWSYRDEIKAMLAADRFAGVTDRAELAAAIAARESSAATRAAALDRCEQVRGERLERYLVYLYKPDDVDWRHLASLCKR